MAIKVTNATITSVQEAGSFSTVSFGNGATTGTVEFDGGNIAPGSSTTVGFITSIASGTKIKPTKISYTDGTERGTSNKDDIFSKAVFGGTLGTEFAGVSIPANQWGYFYQFDRSPDFTENPTRLELAIGNIAPSSVGVLGDTWSVAQLLDDLPQDMVTDGSIVYEITDDMVPENLTGETGIGPSSWSFVSGKMVATYSTAFNPGDVASVLWFTSPIAPEIGGPLGLDADNALIFAGDTLLFSNGAVTPMIPEPSTFVLLWFSVVILCARVFPRWIGQ